MGLSFEEASYRFRSQHQATLLALRRKGKVRFNAPREFEFRADDVAVVIADHLGRLVAATQDDETTQPVEMEPLPTPKQTDREVRAASPTIEVPSTPQG